MQLIDNSLLDKVSEEAKSSLRLRMNYNFHESPDAPVQRLLNALEPGTQIPVHRHQYSDETYVLLRGKIRVFWYNDEGQKIGSDLLDPLEKHYGVHIPAGQWHSLEVLMPGSVILEVKEGPYAPLSPDDLLL